MLNFSEESNTTFVTSSKLKLLSLYSYLALAVFVSPFLDGLFKFLNFKSKLAMFVLF